MSTIKLRAILGLLGLATGVLPPSAAGAAPAHHVNACQRQHSQRLMFSDPTQRDTVVVRAAGASCKRTRITVMVSSAAGRVIWTESVFLSLVNYGQPPDEPLAEISPGDVVRAVDDWVSVEQASDAPAWSDGLGLVVASDDPQQYDTPLARADYLRIKAAGGPMLCIAVGPESAHCIAVDPATRKPMVLFNRGL